MKTKVKLSIFYSAIFLSLCTLSGVFYVCMRRINNTTTMLEEHIRDRNLTYIVDKDYELNIKVHKWETITFLNKLTEFFSNFYRKNIEFRDIMRKFMMQRANVLYRFRKSNINIYNLSVIPNEDLESYRYNPIKQDIDEDKAYIEKLH